MCSSDLVGSGWVTSGSPGGIKLGLATAVMLLFGVSGGATSIEHAVAVVLGDAATAAAAVAG